MDSEKASSSGKSRPQDVDEAVGEGEVLNASGHKQELERNFSLLSICAIGITTGNVWAALGGSIVRSILFHHSIATSTSGPNHRYGSASVLTLPILTTYGTISYSLNLLTVDRSSLFTMADLPALSTSSLPYHAATL
jgi:hypothetical protein